MRSQMFSFSSNTTLLRQALPVLVQPYKSILCRIAPPPNHGFVSNSPTLLRRSGGLPLHDSLSSFILSPIRKFSSRATNINDAGSVDLPLMQSMEKKIKEQLNADSVIVKDAYGDGRHVRWLFMAVCQKSSIELWRMTLQIMVDALE
ncbi:uncharacterized protein LOC130723449 isoform X2 [Lotus japonicus]|uniref:uncharacterized protein LOC130723449 isoform X2 n=1 Tax=Lotus japonicus TaxID=34305 RepID=UPI00258EC7A0|nr:uncharacterized protein LOC130723449 isoform X2 [Lotus japonicus]